MLEFRKASRRAVPMLIGLSGPSGSGKTFSALRMAAGIAGPTGKVAILDTENGRGEMYSDSPTIKGDYPNGFLYARMDPPFAPANYVTGIEAAEKAGIDVLIVDSLSHEWEGIGGCEEIAEEKKNKRTGEPNWKFAKGLHKRFMMRCLCSPIHIIFCLRAREKVKYIKVPKDGKMKTEVIPIGIQPVCEKNFMFEMLVSMRLEDETHRAKPVKVPEPLAGLFPEDVLIGKELGERIREWNETGETLDPREQLQKRARLASVDGVAAYKAFYSALTAGEKKFLQSTIHEECKADAEQADVAAQGDGGEDV